MDSTSTIILIKGRKNKNENKYMEIKRYKCDVCGKEYTKRETLRNEVSLINGEYHFASGEVCDSCAKKIGDFIKSLGANLISNK